MWVGLECVSASEREHDQRPTHPHLKNQEPNSLERGLHVRLLVQVRPRGLGALGEQLADALQDLLERE